MNWLQKLPGFQRSAPGLEWGLWRKLPAIFAAGTALPLLGMVAAPLLAAVGAVLAHTPKAAATMPASRS